MNKAYSHFPKSSEIRSDPLQISWVLYTHLKNSGWFDNFPERTFLNIFFAYSYCGKICFWLLFLFKQMLEEEDVTTSIEHDKKTQDWIEEDETFAKYFFDNKSL